MAEFTPITTQEALDAVLGERLKRERETASKRYEGYASPDQVKQLKSDHEKQIATLTGELTTLRSKQQDHDKELADRDKKIRDYETRSVKTRVAHETGLPWELAERLSGENEDEIRKDAQALLKAIGSTTKTVEPAATKEVRGGEKTSAALRSLAENL